MSSPTDASLYLNEDERLLINLKARLDFYDPRTHEAVSLLQDLLKRVYWADITPGMREKTRLNDSFFGKLLAPGAPNLFDKSHVKLGRKIRRKWEAEAVRIGGMMEEWRRRGEVNEGRVEEDSSEEEEKEEEKGEEKGLTTLVIRQRQPVVESGRR